MGIFYTLLRFYPYWAIPLMVVTFELAWVFTRKKRDLRWFYWAVSILLLVTSVLWLAYGGYKNSDSWIRAISETGE